jgi:DNA (cytosine-5)-methyltransferase 1
MPAYYNEVDPYAAQWLRNLIKAGHIADGEVDERSIADVRADDLRGFIQCHFFAGIGVWSHALRLAGFPDDRPVWTGSCPCQPFSAVGKGEGYADERHLWPHWYRLLSECRPAIVFGEQVAAAIRTGWLDDVCLSLESIGYAVGAVDFPACSVGAPHIRQRLYWVADGVGAGLERQSRHGDDGDESGRDGARAARPIAESGQSGFWSDVEWLPCSDGKARPAKPGIFPLAHGATQRVGRLRAYGNAIVPQAAAAFITAYLDQ